MKVLKFNSSIAGHRFSYHAGDLVEWDNDAEAAAMCERGIAAEILPKQLEKLLQTKDMVKHVAPKTDPRDQQKYPEKTMLETMIERRAAEKMATR